MPNLVEFQRVSESTIDAQSEFTVNSILESNFQGVEPNLEISNRPSPQHITGKRAVSPPRRPTTRSQTGTVTKRRPMDDEYMAETRKKQASHKRQKAVTANYSDPMDSSSSHTQDSASPRPPTREPSLSSTTSAPLHPSQASQLTFYHSSMSESDQPQTRLPRSRTSPPTPIPNLTKKSRGRRVPIKDLTVDNSTPCGKRFYVCTVEGCGKCFHRGEHLKRHIRSIHTHDKPFQCTFPLCEKLFNRHDNLLQHLKVHRQSSSSSNSNSEDPEMETEMGVEQQYHFVDRVSAPRSVRPSRSRRRSPAAEPSVSPAARPRTIYDAFPPRYGPFTPPTHPPPMAYNQLGHNCNPGNIGVPIPAMHEPAPPSLSSHQAMSILSNVAASTLRMEISSLRTELPQSPLDIRGATMAVVPC